MEATLTSQKVVISNRGYPIQTVPYLLPIKLPAVIYDFQGKPKDSQVEDLRQHSTVLSGRKEALQFVMRDPTLEQMRSLVQKYPDVNQTTRHIIGTVNLQAIRMVVTIQKILSAFLLTHVYPAFHHVSDTSPVSDIGKTEVMNKKRKISTTSYVTCMSDPEKHLEDVQANEEEEMSDAPNQGPNIQLKAAKPTSIRDNRWGPVDRMPNLSGLYVPYVRELAIGDTVTLPRLMTDVFLRSLASTQTGMIAAVDKLRSAWGVICTTDTGHELSHLSRCIEIALNAQAIVYPVYTNDVYEGCVIGGAGYSVSIKGVSLVPSSYEDLQKVVRKTSMHSFALSEISDLLSEEGRTDLESCVTMRQVSDVVNREKLDDIGRQHIVKSAYKLSFTNNYWSTSVTNIKRMMELIADPDEDIDVNIPMHPKYLFTNDRIELVLSAFGHQAPSFMITNAAKCALSSREPPRNFHVRTTTVETAVSDMKYVMENRYITNNNQRLSSKHRDIPIKGNDKARIWADLQAIVSSETGKTEEKVQNEDIDERDISDDVF
jgi:hypothetical protein